jgi:hypothetical protein
VDYKTSTHGSEGIEDFLAAERVKYSAQLEAYARTIATTGNVRLALYYPFLSKLTWWEP